MHSSDGVDAAAIDVTTVLLIAESLQKQFGGLHNSNFVLQKQVDGMRARLEQLEAERAAACSFGATPEPPPPPTKLLPAKKAEPPPPRAKAVASNKAPDSEPTSRLTTTMTAIARLKGKCVRGAEPNDPPK